MSLPRFLNPHTWLGVLDRRALQREWRRVASWAHRLDRNLVIADVGCRWGLADTWTSLGKRATVIGFDPDEAECQRLQAGYRGPCDVRFVPRALGASAGTTELHITKDPACSSVFEPDPAITSLMPELDCAKPVRTATVALGTMDAYAREQGLAHMDYMKLDTQGSELMVLQGAEECLKTTRALEIEVEFNPIYRGQPLFKDVDEFLRQRGFVLWRLKDLIHCRSRHASIDFPVVDRHVYSPEVVRIPARGGQLMWAHAYYVKDDLAAFRPPANPQAALRDACLMRLLGFRDLSDFCFSHAAVG